MCTVLLPPRVNPIAVNKYIKYESLIVHTLKITMSLHIPAEPLTTDLRRKCFTISLVNKLHQVRYKINIRSPTWQPGNIHHNTVISSISGDIDSSVVRSNYLLEGVFLLTQCILTDSSKFHICYKVINNWFVSSCFPRKFMNFFVLKKCVHYF